MVKFFSIIHYLAGPDNPCLEPLKTTCDH